MKNSPAFPLQLLEVYIGKESGTHACACMCKFMTVGKISDVRHYTINISSGDFSIPVTDEEIDLRVVFENILKFANHVSQCVHKVSRILGVIKHSFCNLDPHIFTLLYISLVRHRLDYASPV